MAAFAEDLTDHLDDVYRYALYLVREPGLAEDVAQEAFERALKRRRSFDPARAPLKTWLLQLTRSTALDHWRSEERRRRREQAVAMPESTAAFDSASLGLSPDLERALASLAAADREIVALRVVLGMDTKETARMTGISETNCTTRLNRALNRLAKELEETR